MALSKPGCNTGEKQRGSQFDYNDKAIESMLTIKEVFHLTKRGVKGFVRSLFEMMGIDQPVPDHSTSSKRGKTFASTDDSNGRRMQGITGVLWRKPPCFD
jgi:hypothetical protein